MLITKNLGFANWTQVFGDHYEAKNVDIVDGYIAALMEKPDIPVIYSFDRKHLARLKNLKRIEP